MMMERILFGVLCLSVWPIFSTCLMYQYHYVNVSLNWTEAQTFCRERYIDLATTEEMNQILQTVSSVGNKSDIWIGLYGNIQWAWFDLASNTGYGNWENRTETKLYPEYRWCVNIGNGGKWRNDNCSLTYPFICFTGTQADPEFVFVNETMDCFSARSYCIVNFRGLATVRNNMDNLVIQNLVPSGERAWIGLLGGVDIYWSYWGGHFPWDYFVLPNPIDSVKRVCGVVRQQESVKVGLLPCETRLPFVCYRSSNPKTPAAPVKRQVVKLRMKVEDSSVDLNDPAVKAGILKKLQDRLEEKGESGVSLKWREQPDGKVFHKEGEKSSEEEQKKTEL